MGREENGEFCCDFCCCSKPNLTLVALYSLVGSGGAAIWDKLAMWQRGRKSTGVTCQAWKGGDAGPESLSAAGMVRFFFVFPFLFKLT